MKNQLRGEWIKLRSTRLLYGLLGVHLALTLLQLALTFVNAGRLHTPSLGTTGNMLRLITTPSYGQYVVLILGIMVVAGEHRHGTISATYIAQPARSVVLAAKAVATGAIGLAFGIVGVGFAAAVALPWLATSGVELDLAHAKYAVAVAGIIAATAVYGLLGVGLGAVLPNATAAIAVAVGYAVVVENLVVGVAFSEFLRWLPGGAASSLVGAQPLPGGSLSTTTAALVLGLYGAVLLSLGLVASARRDIA